MVFHKQFNCFPINLSGLKLSSGLGKVGKFVEMEKISQSCTRNSLRQGLHQTTSVLCAKSFPFWTMKLPQLQVFDIFCAEPFRLMSTNEFDDGFRFLSTKISSPLLSAHILEQDTHAPSTESFSLGL